MGKFHFHISGRKKPASPEAIDSQALTKAHKILGSTPISIDSLAHLERASSSAVEITDVEGAGRHHPSDDAYLDEQVRLALSEGEWDDDAILPTPRQTFERSSGGRGHSRLKKSQSSSAIRSRTIVQATARHSSTQMPTSDSPFRDRHADEYHAASQSSPRAKKKPAMLDFSNLRPNSRLSRSSCQSQPDSASSTTFHNNHNHNHNHNHNNTAARSTCGMPSLAHSGILGNKRSSLKRRTKESLRSLLSDASGSTSSGGVQRELHPDTGLSTLYNHYEQMSLLQVIKQGRDPEDCNAQQHLKHVDAQDEVEWEEAQADQDLDWLHKPLRDPDPTTAAKSSADASSRKNKGKRVSSRNHVKPPKVSKEPSKPPVRNSEEADFHDKSVLLLSDSEEDEPPANAGADAEADPSANMILLNRTYDGGARSTKARAVARRSAEHVRQPNRRSQESDQCPRKSSKRRTSDGLGGSYASMNGSDASFSPVRRQPAYNPRSPSPRESLSSSDSRASMMTCQFSLGGSDHQNMTILPARRPSQAELDLEAARIRASESAAPRRESLPRSPDQLTPPISPSSVDFFLRSPRSSADTPELPNRIMAVTREEKMLISALRKKNQAMREIARLEAHGHFLGHGFRLQEFGGPSSSKAAGEQTSFEYGFPAPPKIHMQVTQHAESAGEPDRQRPSTDSTGGTAMSPTNGVRSSRRPSCDGSEAASPRDRQGSSAMYQDVLVYLDQRKASFGQGEAMGSIHDLDRLPMMRSIFDAAPVERARDLPHGEDDPPAPINGASLRGRFHIGRIQTENLPPTSPPWLETLCEQDAEELPRAESPISPESFPSLPANRIRARNQARLSAVGFSSPTRLDEP